MICPNCHNDRHEPGAKFCWICGYGFKPEIEPEPEKEEPCLAFECPYTGCEFNPKRLPYREQKELRCSRRGNIGRPLGCIAFRTWAIMHPRYGDET